MAFRHAVPCSLHGPPPEAISSLPGPGLPGAEEHPGKLQLAPCEPVLSILLIKMQPGWSDSELPPRPRDASAWSLQSHRENPESRAVRVSGELAPSTAPSLLLGAMQVGVPEFSHTPSQLEYFCFEETSTIPNCRCFSQTFKAVMLMDANPHFSLP